MNHRILPVFLFLSGAAALVLEVAWFRRLAQTAGATSTALAAILAAVIGGMAAGALLFGRRADRTRRPLRLYALLEAGVTVAALVSPWVFDRIGPLFVALHRSLHDMPAVHMAVAFVVASLLLAPATLLLGGSLPAAAAAMDAPAAQRGRRLGILYGVNTLGAVAGTCLAGFVLLPALRLAGTTRAAAVLSGTAALLAFLWPARDVEPAPPPPARDVRVSSERRTALALCAVSGFLGLASEVAFTRALVLVIGGTTYAFTTVLSVYLLGIGVGGIVGARLVRPGRSLQRLGVVVASTAALLAIASRAIYVLPRLYVEGFIHLPDPFALEQGLALRYVLVALVLLPGAIGLGAAFPLGLDVVAADEAGRGTGRLYAANSFASIAGSTLAVFVLVPTFGPHLATVVLGAGAALAAVALVRRPAVLGAALLVAVGLVPVGDAARSRLLSGVYFDPWFWMRDGQLYEPWWELGTDVPFAAYGRECTASVTRWYGRPAVLVDGKTVASDETASDAEHLALLGHLPMLSHPDPQRVLVVGLGMGTTFNAVALHEPTELTVVEIEEAVSEAAAFLGVRPKRLIIADARTHLRATDELYDVITSDPIHPFVRGGGDLYTIEYFESCRARLAPGGVACQWLPLYQMGVSDVRDVVKTFCTVFRGTAYFTGADLVLVGKVDGDPGLVREPQGRVAEGLQTPDLGSLCIGDHARLVEMTASADVLRDDALQLEFSTPNQLGDPERADCIAWVRDVWETPPSPLDMVLGAAEALSRNEGARADRFLDRALAAAPDHVLVRRFAGEAWLGASTQVLATDGPDAAQDFLDSAAEYLGDDPRLLDAGLEIALARGDRERAQEIGDELLARFPGDAWVAGRVRTALTR